MTPCEACEKQKTEREKAERDRSAAISLLRELLTTHFLSLPMKRRILALLSEAT